MQVFKEYFLCEVKDTKRNRMEIANAYGLADHAPEQVAQDRASEIINKWTKLEPLIDVNYDYFQAPNDRHYNPKDIFSWSRVSRDLGYSKLEALQNLEAMIANLSRAKEKKAQDKISEKDYDIVAQSSIATLYIPKTEAASCKLGASTKWCTAATEGPNQFHSYKEQGVVLFYAIEKATQDKYAVAMYPDGDTFNIFDAEDNQMDWEDWSDIAYRLGLPTEKAFYKKHGPQLIDILKDRARRARDIISGYTQRDPFDGPTNWEILGELLSAVEGIYKEQDPEQIEELKRYRKSENMPDEAFLMEVLDRASLKYFTDGEYNPPGSHNWTNGQFQTEIVRKIGRLTYFINQSNGDDWKQEDIEDMDDLTYEVKGPNDGDEARNVFLEIRRYISRHLNDKWPELEEALIKHWEANHDATNIKVAGGYSEHTDTPFDNTYMWMRMMMDIKNGDWPELEEMIHKRLKSILHKGDKDPDFENKKNGLQSMGVSYNNAANFYRRVDNTDYRAWLPQSDEHFKRYMDGEWDVDGPPLTDQAQRERQYKSISAKKNSSMDQYIDNL